MQANITLQTEDLVTGVASTPVTAEVGFDIIYLKGDKGNSAYEDAVEQGYEGTLEQWLASLKGEKGDRGLQGEQGIQGIQGERGLQGEQGIQGVAGQDGADGYSPTVSINKVNGVTTITITDKNGVHTATINDGQNGTNGTNGQDGADGFSPTVSINKVNGVTTITITDANGQHTATITDGTNGNDGIFWAVQGTTTVQQIQDALDAGKVVYAVKDTFIYRLTDNNSTVFRFFSFYNICTFKSFEIKKFNGTWTGTSTHSALLTSDKISSTSLVAADDNKWYSALKVQNLINAVDDKIGSAVSLTFTYEDNTSATYNLLTTPSNS